MVPGTSTPCVETVIVPVITRVVSFVNAVRPPIAASAFSTASSAVCAWAAPAHNTTQAAAAHLIAVFIASPQEGTLAHVPTDSDTLAPAAPFPALTRTPGAAARGGTNPVVTSS